MKQFKNFLLVFQNQSLPPSSLDPRYAEFLSQLNEIEKLSLPASGLLSSANSIGRAPIPRRHSSSLYNSMSKPTSQLSTLPEVNPLFNNAMINGALDMLNDERFRSRAYSEGSSILSNDSLQEAGGQAQSATSRYKTELCRPFEESGKCKYGDKCQFAHGKHELRHMVRHPKYKTELCRTYHSSGICPYGPRCHFIHNQDDSNLGVQKPAAVTGPIGQSRANNNRPIKLQLASKQLINGFTFPSPLKSPVEAASFLLAASESVFSPSSHEKMNGQFLNYGRGPMSPSGLAFDSRRSSPPLSKFDFPPTNISDMSMHDDGVFCGSVSPCDSDRESATGSPPGFGAAAPSQQRLPIFRCLSQSEQKGV